MNKVVGRLEAVSDAPAELDEAASEVAVLIPCYNEEATIARVVSDFRQCLPRAAIYVYDNNSSDRTREIAAEAGAVVRRERLQGKGNVVRRMFADVEADIYVLVDGDSTYDASVAAKMIETLRREQLDMLVGSRKAGEDFHYRPGHHLGNRMFNWFLTWMFGAVFTDILSGYRVFSRRYVKSFPSLTSGFEIETEMAVHALTLRMPVSEMETRYLERPENSSSKLHTYRDGIRILWVMLSLFRQEKPATFFSIISALLAFISCALATPLAITYMRQGMVPRLPTAVLCTGLMLSALLCFSCGLILDTVTRGRREVRRLAYLNYAAPA